MNPSLSEWIASTPLSAGNAPYVEELCETYLRDPQGVSAAWRACFDALPGRGVTEQPHRPIVAAVAARLTAPRRSGDEGVASEKQGAVSRLMQAYSNRGHLIARIDPLGMMQRERPRVLDLSQLGLGEVDLDTEFYTGSRNAWIDKRATLRQILARLEQIYCGSIGAEFAHVSDTDERLWLQDEFQLGRIEQRFSAEERRSIFWELTAAEGLERYLHTRFVGQKRLSLEES